MKRFVLVVSVLLASGAVFGYSGSAASPPMPSVVLSELMWMGSSLSSSDEWIELANTTDQPIDLAGWKLTKLSGGNEVTMLTVPAGVIAPRGFFVIANSPADESRLAAPPDLVDADVSLVNSKLQVTLYDSSNTLVDRADDGVGTPLAGEYRSGEIWKSMERSPSGVDGTKLESWHTASATAGFDDGSAEQGTPGSVNSNRPPVVVLAVPETVVLGVAATFDASETTDPEQDSLTFAWEFGDGATAVDATPTHVYTAAGTFPVALTVSDGRASSREDRSVAVLAAAPENPPPETDTPIDAPTDIPVPASIRISELMPNPIGSDEAGEFIELANVGTEEANVLGWSLADPSTSFTFSAESPVETIIPAGGFVVLARSVTRIALNNTGEESLTLSAPDRTVIDSVHYVGPVPEGSSYTRNGDAWSWSAAPTPGALNKTTPEDPATPPGQDQGSPTIFETSARVALHELLPNPTGDDAVEEYIEIVNLDTRPINLLGWTLTDTKTKFRIEEDRVLEPNEVAAFLRPETGITLNNDRDSVFLVDPFDAIVNGVAYDRAPEGRAFARHPSGDWRWTKPTPHEPNVFSEPESETEEENVLAVTPLADLPSLDRGSAVRVQGTVIVQPGVLGKRFFYISDGAFGIQIASSRAELPELEIGDRVEVTGTIGSVEGEPRVNVQAEDAIDILESGEAPLPVQLTSLTPNGVLAESSGTLVEKRGTSGTIETSLGRLSLTVTKASGVSLKEFAVGDAIRVVGIVRLRDGRQTLTPRYQDDLSRDGVVAGETAPENNPAAEPQPAVLDLPEPEKRPSFLLTVGAPLGVLGAVAAITLMKRRRRALTLFPHGDGAKGSPSPSLRHSEPVPAGTDEESLRQ